MLYSRPLISKIFYAVLISPLQRRQSTPAKPRGRSSYERTMTAVNFVNRLIPGITNRVSRWMFRNNRFPWAPVDSELIAFGTGAAVIRVKWKDSDTVLRLYRRSLGQSYRELFEIAKYYKKNYEMVHTWYGDSQELVLPMDFVVIQGLPLIGPVAASLQPYVHGEKQDLFEDFSDEEIIRLMKADDQLRDQFLCFAGQTIRQWEGRKMCYDCLGRENLMLVKKEGRYRLHIVDVGIFKFDLPAHSSSQKMAQIKQRMDRIASLYGLLKGL